MLRTGMAARSGPRPSLVAVVLTLVPGLGHWWIGRARRGYFFFLATTFLGNLALLSHIAPVAPLGTWSLNAGIGGALALGLYALADIVRVGVYARWPSVARRRTQKIEEAAAKERDGHVHEAREILDRLLDVDPASPDVRLALARSFRESDDPRRSIHHARKALKASPACAERDDLERELHLAREKLRGR